MTTTKNQRKKVYKHLNILEREEIACLLEKGSTQKEVAHILGRDPATISREVKRNSSQTYQVKYRGNRAQLKADERSKVTHHRPRLKSKKIRKYVIKKLKKGYTPEQIAGRLSIDMKGCKTNYESIYLFIYHERPDLTQYLLRATRKRRKRTAKNGRRGTIVNRVMIGDRPSEIGNREEYGHWEADTVVSKQSKSVLVVVRERKLQLMFIRKIPRKTAKHMRKAVVTMLRRFNPDFVLSITFDNGLENAEHEKIAKFLGVKTYFCNPYHSWEKGGVENGIGLVRRDLPKKTDFSLISDRAIRLIQEKWNNRPRKLLGFLTPLEATKIALSH